MITFVPLMYNRKKFLLCHLNSDIDGDTTKTAYIINYNDEMSDNDINSALLYSRPLSSLRYIVDNKVVVHSFYTQKLTLQLDSIPDEIKMIYNDPGSLFKKRIIDINKPNETDTIKFTINTSHDHFFLDYSFNPEHNKDLSPLYAPKLQDIYRKLLLMRDLNLVSEQQFLETKSKMLSRLEVSNDNNSPNFEILK